MLESTLGAWETLAIRVTLDVPRFVPISTKRAREKVEKGGQLPNAQLISLLESPNVSWEVFSPVEKAPCRGNGEPRAGGGNLASAGKMERY